MNKKNFLTAKNFLILIIFFLFFSENIFGFSFDSRKNFYENFYSDVYDETDYKKKSLERVSDETGLDEEFLLNFYNGVKTQGESSSVIIKCSDENSKAVTSCEKSCNSQLQNDIYCTTRCEDEVVSQFCKAVKNGGDTGKTNYENILKNKINSELKLVKLEQKLRSTAENEEIFADGDYGNSFFDVVTQWNLIDVIIFGKDGMTPFFKYEESEEDKEEKPEDENFIPDEKIENEEENEYKGEEISFFNDKTSQESENEIEKTKDGFYLNISEAQNQNEEILEICIDPYLININSVNEKTASQEGEKLSGLDKILQENNKINSENSENTKNETENSTELVKNQTSKSGFIEPEEDGEICKKPLYGGHICLDGLSFGECFPIGEKPKDEEGNVIESATEGKNGSYCREINMIADSQDLLGNGSAVNCINCYIEKGLNIIEDEIYGEALFPRENSLNNGSLPNLIGTKRDWIPIDISWMAMPWEKENYKKNERKPHIDLEEKYNPEADKILKANGSVKKLEELLSSKTVKQYTEMKGGEILNQDKAAVIKDAYFGDINGRITEFRTLFQNGILDNINGMPFENLKKLPTCEKLKTN